MRVAANQAGSFTRSNWPTSPKAAAASSDGSIFGRIDGLEVGDEVSLRIADLRSIAGEVKWVREREAGLAFAEALDPETIDDLAVTYTIGEPREAGFRGRLNAA